MSNERLDLIETAIERFLTTRNGVPYSGRQLAEEIERELDGKSSKERVQ